MLGFFWNSSARISVYVDQFFPKLKYVIAETILFLYIAFIFHFDDVIMVKNSIKGDKSKFRKFTCYVYGSFIFLESGAYMALFFVPVLAYCSGDFSEILISCSWDFALSEQDLILDHISK